MFSHVFLLSVFKDCGRRLDAERRQNVLDFWAGDRRLGSGDEVRVIINFPGEYC